MKKHIVHCAIGSLVSFAFAAGVVLLLTHVLSPAAFGAIMLMVTLSELLFFVGNLGMDQVFMFYFHVQKTPENQCKLWCVTVAILSVVFLGLYVLGLPFRSYIPHYHCLFALGYLYTLQRFGLIYFRMLMRFVWYNVCSALFHGFLLLLLLCTYVVQSNITVLDVLLCAILAFLIAIVLTGSCLLFYFKRNAIGCSLKTNTAEVLGYLNYGYPFVFSLGLFWGLRSIDKFILLHFQGFHALGIYTAAFVLATPLFFIQTIFTTVWVPIRNKLITLEIAQAQMALSQYYRKIFLSLFAALLILFGVRHDIVWILPAVYTQAITAFSWLLFVPFFWGLSEIVVSGILISKKTYWNIVISVLCLCVNVLFCVLLIPRVGLSGAAMALALAYGVLFVARWGIAFRYYPFDIAILPLLGVSVLYALLVMFQHVWLTSAILYMTLWGVLIGYLLKLWYQPVTASVNPSPKLPQ